MHTGQHWHKMRSRHSRLRTAGQPSREPERTSVQFMGTARSTCQPPSTSLLPTRHSFCPYLQR